MEDDSKQKDNRLYSILFGGAVGGIIALILCSCMLLGNYFMTANSLEPPPEPPFLIFLAIFVLMAASGAYIANRRMSRKKSAPGNGARSDKSDASIEEADV